MRGQRRDGRRAIAIALVFEQRTDALVQLYALGRAEALVDGLPDERVAEGIASERSAVGVLIAQPAWMPEGVDARGSRQNLPTP